MLSKMTNTDLLFTISFALFTKNAFMGIWALPGTKAAWT
jgi:hypothetical protein